MPQRHWFIVRSGVGDRDPPIGRNQAGGGERVRRVLEKRRPRRRAVPDEIAHVPVLCTGSFLCPLHREDVATNGGDIADLEDKASGGIVQGDGEDFTSGQCREVSG